MAKRNNVFRSRRRPSLPPGHGLLTEEQAKELTEKIFESLAKGDDESERIDVYALIAEAVYGEGTRPNRDKIKAIMHGMAYSVGKVDENHWYSILTKAIMEYGEIASTDNRGTTAE